MLDISCSLSCCREFSLDKTGTIYILSGFERAGRDNYLKLRIDDIKNKAVVLAAEESVVAYTDLQSMVDAGECQFPEPLRLSFTAMKEYDHIRVAGNVETVVRLNCSRCLVEYDLPINSSFTIFYTKAAGMPLDEEVELAEVDLISASYEGDEIDFAPEVTAQVITEIPFKPLCNEDCRGLCSKCGISLNESSCDCDRNGAGFKFSALKGIKIEK